MVLSRRVLGATCGLLLACGSRSGSGASAHTEPDRQPKPTDGGSISVVSMPEMETLPFEHGTDVRAIDWSRDGALLVTSAGDARVRLFDGRSGVLRRILAQGERGLPPWVSFAPGGEQIAVGDRSIEIYSAMGAAGTPPTTTIEVGDFGELQSPIVWGPDGASVFAFVSRSDDGRTTHDLKRWQVPGGTELPAAERVRLAGPASVRAAFVDSDNLAIVFGDALRVVDPRSGRTKSTHPLGGAFSALAVSAHGILVANRRELLLVDSTTGVKTKTPLGRGPSSGSMLSASGALAAIGRGDGLELIDLSAGRSRTAVFSGVHWGDDVARGRAVAIRPDGGVVAHSVFSRLDLRGLPELSPLASRTTHESAATLLMWTADGKSVLSLGSRRLCAWDSKAGVPAWCAELPFDADARSPPLGMWFASDDQVAVIAEGWSVAVSLATGTTEPANLHDEGPAVPWLNTSARSHRAVAIELTDPNRLHVAMATEADDLVPTGALPQCFDASADGSHWILGLGSTGILIGHDGTAKLHPATRPVDVCAISQDGQSAILGPGNARQPLQHWTLGDVPRATSSWEPPMGDENLPPLERAAVALSAGGSQVGVALRQGLGGRLGGRATLRVWAVQTGKVTEVSRFTQSATTVAFSPDDAALAVATVDTRIHLVRGL